MIWFLLQKVGFFIFLFLTVFFVMKRKYEHLLSLYFWGMTFTTCYYFLVTIWFPVKIIALGMVVCMLLYGFNRKSTALQIIVPFISAFALLLIISDSVGLLFPGDLSPHFNRLVRMVNANYTYITTSILLLFGMMLEKGFVKRIYPQYCLAIEVGIIFGLIHLICLKTGVQFMPILRQNGTVNLEAVAQMGGVAMQRIYGVSGEPKNLGFLICPYLLMSIVMLGQRMYRINKGYHLTFLLLGIVVLINTYSSSALLNFFLAIPLLMLFVPFPRLTVRLATITACCCLCGALWFLHRELDRNTDFPDKGNFVEQMYERTFGRAQNEMEGDRQERIILDSFWGNDTGTGYKLLGWGVAQYTFHVPGQTIGNALIPVQSGLVLTLTDFGILGLLFLAVLAYILIKMLLLSLRVGNNYAVAFAVAALSSFIGSLMFGSLINCFIYLMLALYAFYDELETT